MRNSRGGFTLIELLVVIVIIAILAAILFPVFVRAREKGKEASCKSNMRQIAIAIQQYLDDYDSCYPDQACISSTMAYRGLSGYSNAFGQQWIDNFSHRYRTEYPANSKRYIPGGIGKVLRPYIKSLGVFKCSSEQKRRPTIPGYDTKWYPIFSSYYVKHAMCYYANAKLRPLRLSDIRYPLRAAFIFEEAWHSNRQYPFLYDPMVEGTSTGTGSPPPNDGTPFIKINVVYFDCHVGTCQLPRLTQYNCYSGNWYWYDKYGNKIPDSNGMTQGWNLTDGVRDKQ